MIRIPRFAVVVSVALAVLNGCASVPRDTDEARDFAHKKMELTEFRRPAKEFAAVGEKLRAFADRCIHETVILHHRFHRADETGDTYLKFRTTYVKEDGRAELFVQKDLGNMTNLPDGGLFYFYAEAEAPKGPDFPVRLYSMDSYGFRSRNIAAALQSNLTAGSSTCPTFNPDPDNL
ncbi:MAG: hypothetical protein JST04_08010 [Bdellovibrionales bacterium]|nr:hypothetical protein [Bdellovibrionales bacterium]